MFADTVLLYNVSGKSPAVGRACAVKYDYFFFDRIALVLAQKSFYYNRYCCSRTTCKRYNCVFICISSVCLNMYSFSVRQTAQPLPPSTTATQVPRWLHRALAGKKKRSLFAYFYINPSIKNYCFAIGTPRDIMASVKIRVASQQATCYDVKHLL